jgi:hypothetical protein
MPRLPDVQCPKCNETMRQTDLVSSVRAARRYDDCLRKCEKCEVGASNVERTNSVTFIHEDPLQNIPAESRGGAPQTLRDALNERSRETKRIRFGFSTSEDAITWVVFTYLLRSGRLVEALIKVGLAPPDAAAVSPSLPLWGVPVDDYGHGSSIRESLLDRCRELHERRSSYSEPDVIVDLGRFGLIFIEAKCRSGNDVKPLNYRGWRKYINASRVDWQREDVIESGLYELARNWCLMSGIAAEGPKTLVNLGSDEIFARQDLERLKRFALAIRSDSTSNFKQTSWTQFLDPVIDQSPKWFSDFCRSRNLVSSSR